MRFSSVLLFLEVLFFSYIPVFFGVREMGNWQRVNRGLAGYYDTIGRNSKPDISNAHPLQKCHKPSDVFTSVLPKFFREGLHGRP